MEIVIDIKALEEEAQAFSRRMYDERDPRREKCARQFFHENYMKMRSPPIENREARIERLLTEIHDLVRANGQQPLSPK